VALRILTPKAQHVPTVQHSSFQTEMMSSCNLHFSSWQPLRASAFKITYILRGVLLRVEEEMEGLFKADAVRRRRRRKGLFKASAVNEEDSERDRATLV
jgi:hypothetical protein